MVAPDVQIEDGKGTILISSEEGETEGKGGEADCGRVAQERGRVRVAQRRRSSRLSRRLPLLWWLKASLRHRSSTS